MVVRLRDLVKAIRTAVDMQAIDHARLVHGVEVVIDCSHCDAGHFQLGKKEDLVRRQMPIGMVENVQDQLPLLCHVITFFHFRLRIILILLYDKKILLSTIFLLFFLNFLKKAKKSFQKDFFMI